MRSEEALTIILTTIPPAPRRKRRGRKGRLDEMHAAWDAKDAEDAADREKLLACPGFVNDCEHAVDIGHKAQQFFARVDAELNSREPGSAPHSTDPGPLSPPRRSQAVAEEAAAKLDRMHPPARSTKEADRVKWIADQAVRITATSTTPWDRAVERTAEEWDRYGDSGHKPPPWTAQLQRYETRTAEQEQQDRLGIGVDTFSQAVLEHFDDEQSTSQYSPETLRRLRAMHHGISHTTLREDVASQTEAISTMLDSPAPQPFDAGSYLMAQGGARAAAAQNPPCPPELLRQLAEASDSTAGGSLSDQIEAALRTNPKSSYSEIAAKLGASQSYVSQIARERHLRRGWSGH